MTTIVLSEAPPSVNRMFANVPGKGRVKTRAYRLWLKTAKMEVMCQRPGQHTGRVDILVRLPETIRGDASNRIKAAEDLLVTMGVIPDDAKKYVRRSSAEFAPVERPEIVITECIAEAA